MRKKRGGCGCNKTNGGGSILGKIGKTIKKTLKRGLTLSKNVYGKIKSKVFRKKTIKKHRR